MKTNKTQPQDNKISLSKFIKSHILLVIIIIICSLINVYVDIKIVSYTKEIISTVVINNNTDELTKIILKMFFIVCASVLSKYLSVYLIERLSSIRLYEIRKQIIHHIGNASIEKIKKVDFGDIISRFTNDTFIIEEFYKNCMTELFYRPIVIVASLIYLIFINWKLFLLVTGLFIVIFLVYFLINTSVVNNFKSLQESIGQSNSDIQDVLASIEVVKVFNLKEILGTFYKNKVDKILEKSTVLDKKRSAAIVFSFLNNVLPTLLCIIFGGYLASKGEVTLDDMIAFICLLNYVVQSMAVMPNLITDIKVTSAAQKRILEIFNLKLERVDGESFLSSDEQNILEFNNVYFKYDEDNQVLKDINFTLKKGELLSIVGLSGSGKSTIIKLICGFLSPNQGEIKLNGGELEKWNLNEARKIISIVTQNIFIFPGTIRENLSLLNEDISLEEIVDACKIVEAHGFIEKLPNGYDTVLAEGGKGLSIGQKQRLTIARAILKKSSFLILDESTSALDESSQSKIIKNLMKYMKDRSIIIIAHNMSVVSKSDEIIVLEKGEIVERGTHKQLQENRGLYHNFCLKQEVK